MNLQLTIFTVELAHAYIFSLLIIIFFAIYLNNNKHLNSHQHTALQALKNFFPFILFNFFLAFIFHSLFLHDIHSDANFFLSFLFIFIIFLLPYQKASFTRTRKICENLRVKSDFTPIQCEKLKSFRLSISRGMHMHFSFTPQLLKELNPTFKKSN